jgi:tRNA pseudouridine38-40 synthase
MTGSQSLQRWRCLCAYDGTDFNGWQKQTNREAVQDKIEQSLADIFGFPVRTIGAGRTDAGVHADGQVFHFDAVWKHSSRALLQALRVSLPPGISIRKVESASSRFHAHLSARGKRYRYRICRGWAMPDQERYVHSLKDRPIDLEAMKQASAHFVGTHDFAAFAANRGNGDTEPTVRKIWRSEWFEKKGNEYHYVTEGSGYLYKMVRSMVGAMLDVGFGRIAPDEIGEILQTSKRTARVVSAPAKGLRMERVFYRLPRSAGISS